MRRRVLVALAACLLAVVGSLVLVSYVRTADARAAAGEVQVPVLVVAAMVPAGTDAALVAASVTTVDVPARLATPDRVTDLAALAELNGQVTTAALLPGEQVQLDRFADPAALLPAGTVAVPAGLQEVAVTLEPQRAVAGALAPGDLVGVYVSEVVTDDGVNRTVTRQVLDRVLVTRIENQVTDAGTDSNGAIAAASAPSTALTVTVAVTAGQAPFLVQGMELGTVWMSLQVPAPGADRTTVTTSTQGADQ
jgi:pilus assembly protein CpaB